MLYKKCQCLDSNSGIGTDRSANCTTTTAPKNEIVYMIEMDKLSVKTISRRKRLLENESLRPR